MNQASTRLSHEALDFAPRLLAIQESPPPKLPRTILLLVATLFIILVIWASFGKLDIVATADGKLIPQTYVKIVQPSDSGIVADILVTEGDMVEAGQVLMRMDELITESDVRTTRNEYDLKRLQLARINAELNGVEMEQSDEYPSDLFNKVVQQYVANRKAYRDSIAHEEATLEKTRNELLAARESLRKLKAILPSYKKSAEAFGKVGKDGFVSNVVADEKKREYLEKQYDLLTQQATVESLKSVITVSKRKIAQIESSYRKDLQDERIDTEAKIKRLREELNKVEHKEKMLALRAPQKGTIMELATHTEGTVVSPGSVLMSLVPYDEPLRAEVYVRNEDVGFVHIGQQVKVKMAAYPFQKYGMLEGTIVYVDPDTAKSNPTSTTEGSQQEMRYKAVVKLDSQELSVDGKTLKLAPGMQVIADIHLGDRTVMEYLLSPVQKAWMESGRER